MARERPIAWRCGHLYPVEVVPIGEEKHARCLGCGACGPARANTEEAILALRAEARLRNNVGA